MWKHNCRSSLLAGVLFCGTLIAASAKPLPDLSFQTLDNQPARLSALHGSIVVLSFWATWCEPCKEELPRLSTLSEQYAGKHVRFVAVSIDEKKDWPKIQTFLSERNLKLEVWKDGNLEKLDRVGLGEIVPGTIVLDADGQVITRITGEAREEDIRSRLDWLLNGREGPAPETKLKRL